MVICITVTFLSALTSLALLYPLSLTTRFCPQNCCSLDVFNFFCTILCQSTLSGTNIHSTVKVTGITLLPHFDIWSEQQLNLFTTSAYFYAFSCCHMIGWLNIWINKLVYQLNCSLSVYVYVKLSGTRSEDHCPKYLHKAVWTESLPGLTGSAQADKTRLQIFINLFWRALGTLQMFKTCFRSPPFYKFGRWWRNTYYGPPEGATVPSFIRSPI